MLDIGNHTPAPFDRFAQFRESEGKSLAELLDEFARLPLDNLATNARPKNGTSRGPAVHLPCLPGPAFMDLAKLPRPGVEHRNHDDRGAHG